MFILEDFSNEWNYTFIVVAIIAISIGSFFAIKNLKKNNLKSRRERRNSNNK